MGKSVYTDRYARFLVSLVGARKEAGLTQKDVASRLRRAQSFVSKCESGERRVDVGELLDFADAVGFDPCVMLRGLWKRPRPSKKR